MSAAALASAQEAPGARRPQGAFCVADDCLNLARKGGYCWAHIKRRLRQRPVLGEAVAHKHQTPRQLLAEAALAYADADTTTDITFRLAWDRLRKAALRYVLSDKHPNQHTRRR